MAGLRPQELLVILLILLVLFGGSQLPKLAKNLGQAQKEFRSGFDDGAKGESKGKDKDRSGADTPEDAV